MFESKALFFPPQRFIIPADRTLHLNAIKIVIEIICKVTKKLRTAWVMERRPCRVLRVNPTYNQHVCHFVLSLEIKACWVYWRVELKWIHTVKLLVFIFGSCWFCCLTLCFHLISRKQPANTSEASKHHNSILVCLNQLTCRRCLSKGRSWSVLAIRTPSWVTWYSWDGGWR